jgi:hypothetical protein
MIAWNGLGATDDEIAEEGYDAIKCMMVSSEIFSFTVNQLIDSVVVYLHHHMVLRSHSYQVQCMLHIDSYCRPEDLGRLVIVRLNGCLQSRLASHFDLRVCSMHTDSVCLCLDLNPAWPSLTPSDSIGIPPFQAADA